MRGKVRRLDRTADLTEAAVVMPDDALKSYFTPPKSLPGFPKARKVKGKTGMGGGKIRRRWIDDDSGDILEWDYQHGKLERYNDRGKHLGEYDPSGTQTKPAEKSRTITPTITRKKGDMEFSLAFYDKRTDALVGEVILCRTDADAVREGFGLAREDYPGDCLPVGDWHVAWVESHLGDVRLDIDLAAFNYFVEVH